MIIMAHKYKKEDYVPVPFENYVSIPKRCIKFKTVGGKRIPHVQGMNIYGKKVWTPLKVLRPRTLSEKYDVAHGVHI